MTEVTRESVEEYRGFSIFKITYFMKNGLDEDTEVIYSVEREGAEYARSYDLTEIKKVVDEMLV